MRLLTKIEIENLLADLRNDLKIKVEALTKDKLIILEELRNDI